MMKQATALACRTLLAALALMAGSTALAGAPKVTICHKPPGNPANAHTIRVSIHAWPAHKSHGDSLGECGDIPSGGDGSTSEGGGSTSGGDTGVSDSNGGSTGSSAEESFEILLCGQGKQGRKIRVGTTGQIVVSHAECS